MVPQRSRKNPYLFRDVLKGLHSNLTPPREDDPTRSRRPAVSELPREPTSLRSSRSLFRPAT
jgi:hypothetical protein